MAAEVGNSGSKVQAQNAVRVEHLQLGSNIIKRAALSMARPNGTYNDRCHFDFVVFSMAEDSVLFVSGR